MVCGVFLYFWLRGRGVCLWLARYLSAQYLGVQCLSVLVMVLYLSVLGAAPACTCGCVVSF
jgi:hypothetical protein